MNIITYTVIYFIIAFLILITVKIILKERFKKMGENLKETYNFEIIVSCLLFPVTFVILILMSPFYIGKYITKTIDNFYN